MRIRGRGPVLAALLLSALAAGRSEADNNPNGMVFRAVGYFKGKSEITAGQIKCEIPTVTDAIADGAFAMGLWNTYGSQTIYFPDLNNPFGNPCGGWIQLQNNMIDQAINVNYIELHYRILGAGRLKRQGAVPTQNGFPTACSAFRKDRIYAGTRINPSNSSQDTSGSGAPNVAFINLLPMVSPQLISCLRTQYAPLPTDIYTSLPLTIRARAFGTADAGDDFKSNPIRYTLNLRHFCGNGRVDDGEFCDPALAGSCNGICDGGACTNNARVCTTDADCGGTCILAGDPSECICSF